jgi:hypothetical protein
MRNSSEVDVSVEEGWSQSRNIEKYLGLFAISRLIKAPARI